MTITNVLAIALVSDFDSATSWYQQLLDRAPDRSPMAGTAVWQLSSTGALQINHAPDRAGGANIVIGVPEVDTLVASCNERGIELTAETEPSGQFRLARTADPDGNMVVFAQDLGDAAVNQPSA